MVVPVAAAHSVLTAATVDLVRVRVACQPIIGMAADDRLDLGKHVALTGLAVCTLIGGIHADRRTPLGVADGVVAWTAVEHVWARTRTADARVAVAVGQPVRAVTAAQLVPAPRRRAAGLAPSPDEPVIPRAAVERVAKRRPSQPGRELIVACTSPEDARSDVVGGVELVVAAVRQDRGRNAADTTSSRDTH